MSHGRTNCVATLNLFFIFVCLFVLHQFFREKLQGKTMSEFAPLQQCNPKKREDRELVVDLLLAANYLDC